MVHFPNTYGEIAMTQTVQPCSSVLIGKLIIDKPEKDENSRLLLSVFDSLNNLYEKLNKLDYLIRRRNIEQILFRSKKGGEK